MCHIYYQPINSNTKTFQTLPFILAVISKNRYKYQKFLDFPGLYIYPDNYNKDDEYNEECSKQIDGAFKKFWIKYLAMLASSIFTIVGPAHAYIANGTLVSTTELRIPFVTEGSTLEFVMNLLLQLNIYVHGITMYIGIEVLVSIIENIVTILPKLVKYDLRKLISNQNLKKFSEHQSRVYFTNIVHEILDSEK